MYFLLNLCETLKAFAIGRSTTFGTSKFYAVQYEMLPKRRDYIDGDGITYIGIGAEMA